MCGRFTLTVTIEELLTYFYTDSFTQAYVPRFNIAPAQMVISVLSHQDKNRIGMLRWGLIPHWAKDESIGSRLINAKAETLAEKPSFRQSFERKRCLIPADGFYEWAASGSSKSRQPYRFVLPERRLFCFAGLYDTWVSPGGEKIHTCTIITTEPNDLVRPVHNRMPVILEQEDEAVWLDRSLTEPSRLQPLLRPYSSGKMQAYPVSAKVGSVRYDEPELIEQITL